MATRKGKTNNPNGQPPHKPTDEQRKEVETLAGFGIPQVDIAREIGINDETLRKHYRAELDGGVTKANSRVAQGLYRRAVDGSDTAAIFWLKTRAGWKETVVNEHSGKIGIEKITRNIVKPSN